ncbi:hypothetical protein HYN56_03235 [Flavobacterium crocinum]|uniref:Signal peptidase n=1 Tax=Flavobacterium crocinum TaxID=2183896 RepID=A0A2S1YGX5_9FLAO|nr:hypothetical protein [Flavobacterium crocinum]AWK03286.1 hypothetical protein HYN56_03235 [Flavobacterium crocinum]
MKNLKAPFLAFVVILLNISVASATPTPPPPGKFTARSASVQSVEGTENENDDEGDPEGEGQEGWPDMPIDQNITILLIGGLALGAAVIYRNQTKKASN